MNSTKLIATSAVTAGLFGLGVSETFAGGPPTPTYEIRSMNRVSACFIDMWTPDENKVSVQGGVNSLDQCRRKAETALKRACRAYKRDEEGPIATAIYGFRSFDDLDDEDVVRNVRYDRFPWQGEDYLMMDCTTGEFLED